MSVPAIQRVARRSLIWEQGNAIDFIRMLRNLALIATNLVTGPTQAVNAVHSFQDGDTSDGITCLIFCLISVAVILVFGYLEIHRRKQSAQANKDIVATQTAEQAAKDAEQAERQRILDLERLERQLATNVTVPAPLNEILAGRRQPQQK